MCVLCFVLGVRVCLHVYIYVYTNITYIYLIHIFINIYMSCIRVCVYIGLF